MNSQPSKTQISAIVQLIDVMARLRDPVEGCPWDIEQTFKTIAPYTIEEAYEVADAIERDDMVDLCEELGDLLLQVVYHARIAEESGYFSFHDVAKGISNKMIRRHPHVFGDDIGEKIVSADSQPDAWEDHKALERAEKLTSEETADTLDGVAKGFPALLRAYKLQKRAARVGFDWPNVYGAIEKLGEEISELSEVVGHENTPIDRVRLIDEFGDVLFSIANVARKLGVDPEEALRHTNTKFEYRFRYMEQSLRASGMPIEQATLSEMEQLWQQAKSKG